MKSRTLFSLFAITVMVVTVSACSSFHSLASIHEGGGHHQPKADQISGQWAVTFHGDNNDVTFTRDMKLKLDGETVTGTFESDQTGSGTIKGKWSENKLTMSMESAQGTMEVIALLKDGKLKGTWDVGHMQGKLEASKKDASPK